jgi:hypothetical protein
VQADGKSKHPYYITPNDQDVFGFAAYGIPRAAPMAS